MPDIDQDKLRPLLRYAECVPTAARSFTVPADRCVLYGFTETLLQQVVDCIPMREVNGTRHFDPYDLNNLALYLGLPSLQRMAMRSWRSSLVHASNGSALTYRLEYRIEKEHCDGEVLQLMMPGSRSSTSSSAGPCLWRGEIHRDSTVPALPGNIVELIHTVLDGLTFYMLPEAVRWDVEFIKATGLAECGGASKLLASAAHRYGFRARHVFGLILAQPYGTPHFWSEFLIDDTWVASDALLIRVLTQTAALDTQRWPETRSPGTILLRLADVASYDPRGRPILEHFTSPPRYVLHPIVMRDEESVPASFPVEIEHRPARTTG